MKVITIANQELGYLEKKSNSCLDDKTANAGSGNFTKYWRDIKPSFQGQAWCLCFAIWCFVQAHGLDKAKKMLLMTSGLDFYTPTTAKRFYDKKKFFNCPQIGDLIFFRSDSAEKQGRWKGVHHVGIVYKVSNGYVYTIEGNTSAGNQVIPNGGGVCAKQYKLGIAEIAGYGRPDNDKKCEEQTIQEIPITCSRELVMVVDTPSLSIRKSPVDGAIIGNYKKGDRIELLSKCQPQGGDYWFKTSKGWIGSHYLRGWIKEMNNQWWYLDKGEYPNNCLKEIAGKTYIFDKDGWMITSNRINSSGELTGIC